MIIQVRHEAAVEFLAIPSTSRQAAAANTLRTCTRRCLGRGMRRLDGGQRMQALIQFHFSLCLEGVGRLDQNVQNATLSIVEMTAVVCLDRRLRHRMQSTIE